MSDRNDDFPIDDPDDDTIPANPRYRRFVSLFAIAIVIAVLVFLIWFTAENSNPPEDQPGLLGYREAATSPLSLKI